MDYDNQTAVPSGVPPHVWNFIHQFIIGEANQNLDLRVPHIRPSIAKYVSFIIFMYSILIAVGVICNLAVFFHIMKYKLYNEPTYSFIINNVISDLVKCVFIVPISLYVLLIQNWILGELLCSFLPMLQDIPLHTTTLTFLLIFWDRYRYVRRPTKPRLPAFVCIVGTWLTSVCLVLPYPIYIMYVDLGKYLEAEQFYGVGLCTVNLVDDMNEYIRGIFIVMSSRGECDVISQYSRGSYRDHEAARARYEQYEPDLNVPKEKRTQKYLILMVVVYAISLCPLMILKLAKPLLPETYDNSGNFDLIYTISVWAGFMPTCSTPLFYAAWQMSRSSKERLRGYFRISNRKLQQSCETVMTGSGTPAPSRSKLCSDSMTQNIDEGYSDNNSFQQDYYSS
ncbi:neuropeptide F receptor isoform X2 [Aethina tumida]|uniref:neuropeptide F receptor isoform X2 n=1 Tax=Aethina tumida TaxID=116153 RepID=UPI00214922AB|nr:neuropeptide F receptor isoform X2 [Aethina tumida]